MPICSHTRFYLRKQRGEDNRKRGHVTLVMRKPPEISLSTASDRALQGFQGQDPRFQEGARNEAVTDGNIYFFGSLPFQIFSEIWMNGKGSSC